jgi:hypothetical protein
MEIVEFEPGELEVFASSLKVEHVALVNAALDGLESEAWDFEQEEKLFRKIDNDIWCLRIGPSLWHARRDLGIPVDPHSKSVPVLLRLYFYQSTFHQLLLLGCLNKTPGNQAEGQLAVIAKVRNRRSQL